VIKAWLLHQSEEVGRALRRIEAQGRTVTLKIKFNDFQAVTRNATLARPTDCTRTIYRTACTLLDRLSLSRSVRLCGVSVSQFERPQAQLSLFPEQNTAPEGNLDRAADAITSKYGPRALVRGAVLDLSKKSS
jgi:DNA polymerase-4